MSKDIHFSFKDLLAQDAAGTIRNFDANAKDSDGQTLLMAAIVLGREELIDTLLQNPDIKVNAQDDNGRTALMYAVINGHQAIVDGLLQVQKINPNVQDKQGLSALMLVININCDLILVRKLMTHPKIDINLQDAYCRTALMFAALYGEQEVVALLLQHPKIDDTLKDRQGRTTFFFAEKLCRSMVAEQLLYHPRIT